MEPSDGRSGRRNTPPPGHLSCLVAKMILATYKSEAHPPGPIDCPGVGTVRYRAGYR
jgi:hypothetical protein